MAYDPQTGVRFAAFEVGMLAKLDDLDPAKVDALREKAERELPDPGNVVRRAIIGFATQYEILRRDPVALRRLGHDLCTAVEHSCVPVPPGMARSDING